MSKIGEGEGPVKGPTMKDYHTQVERSAARFENAFSSYQMTNDAYQKAELKTIMDQQLGLIREAVREIQRGGMAKQEAKVEADYQKFIQSPSSENIAALEHDLQTLRDYNKL